MTPRERVAGRVLAIDPGQRRVGIAISDRERTMAFPRPALLVQATRPILDALEELVREEEITSVVVGLPIGLSGSEGASARAARTVADELAVRIKDAGIDVSMFDERLTTVEASRSLSQAGQSTRAQRAVIDSAAATVLLESWLRCQ